MTTISYEELQGLVSYTVYGSMLPFFLILKIFQRKVEPKKIILKRLRKEQTLREISESEFEGKGRGPIKPCVLAFTLKQKLSVTHIVKLCIAELRNAGYVISQDPTLPDLQSFVCIIRHDEEKYYMTIIGGTHIECSYHIHFQKIKSKKK